MIDRILAHLRKMDEAVVDEVRPLRHCTALLTPELPLVWQLNSLRIDDATAGPEALVGEADRALAEYGHRKLVTHDPGLGKRLSGPLTAAGWNAFRLLVMVRDGALGRAVPASPGAEIDRAAGAAGLAAFRREQPFGWQEAAVEQLAGMDDRYTEAAGARDFAAPPGDPACVCRLYSSDGVGQVDEVGTIEARRGRGHGSAAVLAAVAAAESEGLDPIFLLTDANDWPRRWYGTLGFSAIASVYEFLKLPVDSRT